MAKKEVQPQNTPDKPCPFSPVILSAIAREEIFHMKFQIMSQLNIVTCNDVGFFFS